MAHDHDHHAENVAPYVLGALESDEIEALEAHLRACGKCQRELAELRSGAEALSRAVEQIEPPASLRERILEGIAAEEAEAAASPAAAGGGARSGPAARVGRRLRRSGAMLLPRPALAAAMTVLAFAAGAAGWVLGGTSGQDARVLAGTIDRSRLPEASAKVTVPADGEDPVLRLAGLRNLGPQRTYEIWVQRDGELAPGPLFSPNAGGEAMTGIPGDARDIEAIYITREPAGGGRTPSEQPIVSVPLS